MGDTAGTWEAGIGMGMVDVSSVGLMLVFSFSFLISSLLLVYPAIFMSWLILEC